MHFKTADEAVRAARLVIDSARPRCGATTVIAIDGPSGAGKTDFAAALAGHLQQAQTLHMDDLYPGWDGLARAVANLHSQILAPLAGGGHAAYHGWDWEQSRYAGWRSLPATDLLVVEGAGSGARPGSQLISALIWLQAPHDQRFERAIERDGELYRPHWRRWAEQEEALFALDDTRSRADLIIDT